MWRTQAEIEWAQRWISIVACCQSVKLCILAAWAFQSQQSSVWPGCEGGARCNLHKKNVPQVQFTAKGGDFVATSQLMLRWKWDSPQMGCPQRATHKYMWHEQAKIEWSRRVISIIACCQSVKLCALAVRVFWSQHKKYTSLSFACLIHENGQRWTCSLLGFKSCDIWIYWWIWMLSFLFEQISIGIGYFLLNFIATFGSVLRLQVTAG